MIKASELRIGNKFNCYGIEITIDGILKDYVLYSDEGRFAIDALDPIPLTEDWLLKFGFKKTGIIDSENCLTWTKSNMDIQLIDSKQNIFKFHIFYGTFKANNVRDIITKIQYVHQLQNLYFALTGTELTTKP